MCSTSIASMKYRSLGKKWEKVGNNKGLNTRGMRNAEHEKSTKKEHHSIDFLLFSWCKSASQDGKRGTFGEKKVAQETFYVRLASRNTKVIWIK